jgi:DNA-binding MarR family transcriptional regulator
MLIDERLVEAVERLVIEAVGITTIALNQAVPGIDVTLPQWRALVVIGGRATGVRVGEIATRVGSSVPTASRLVSRLERRGLVEVERDAADRRATLVRLTPLGETHRRALVDQRRLLIRQSLLARGPLTRDLTAGLEEIGEALAIYG